MLSEPHLILRFTEESKPYEFELNKLWQNFGDFLNDFQNSFFGGLSFYSCLLHNMQISVTAVCEPTTMVFH